MSAAHSSTRPSRSRSSARRWHAARCSAPCSWRSPRWWRRRRAKRATSCWPSWSRAGAPRRSRSPDRAGAFDPALVTVTADGDALTGTVERVVDAGAADDLLVAARGADGVALYAVDAAAAEVQRSPLVTLDLTRPQATVTLSGAAGSAGGGSGRGRARHRACTAGRFGAAGRRAGRRGPASAGSVGRLCEVAGCSSAGRSDRSRPSSTSWRTCSSTSSTRGRRPTTRCGL